MPDPRGLPASDAVLDTMLQELQRLEREGGELRRRDSLIPPGSDCELPEDLEQPDGCGRPGGG